MVYLDTSVVMAHLGSESVRPDDSLWKEQLVSSRLLVYETFCRLSSLKRTSTHGALARDVLRRISLLEMIDPILGRVTDPFPIPVRALDALHLATITFLVEQGVPMRLASYDKRLLAAANAMGIPSYDL